MKRLLLIAALLVMAGCARHPPETVCTRSHVDSGFMMIPITTFDSNNNVSIILQPQYYEETVCDSRRYTTQEEKDAFCKEYTCEKK